MLLGLPLRAAASQRLTLTVDASTLFNSLGFSTDRTATSRVGERVVTAGGHTAEVVAYCPAGDDPEDEEALWKVRHEDDDFEDDFEDEDDDFDRDEL